jgi:hypothetical protein
MANVFENHSSAAQMRHDPDRSAPLTAAPKPDTHASADPALASTPPEADASTSITIGDSSIRLECNCTIIAAAELRADGMWQASNWPHLLDRNQAITALAIAELLARGLASSDPVMTALYAELPS